MSTVKISLLDKELDTWELQVLVHKLPHIQDMLHLLWAHEVNKEAVQLFKLQ